MGRVAQYSRDLVMPEDKQIHPWTFGDTQRKRTRVEGRSSSRDGLSRWNLPDFTLASPFSDVKLVSATEVVLFGSKYNLSQRSPVLNRMLLNGMKETSLAQEMVSIPFPDMSTEALKFLLEYSFTGAIRVYRYHKTPVEVIHVCRYFQLHENPVQVLEEALHHLQMSNTDGHLTYCEISDRAADILSKALECLSVDEDKKLFDYLLKILLSRDLQSISPHCLTAKALRFLLSRSLASDAEEITPFATTEVDTCLYLMLWAAQQLPGTAATEMQDFVNKLEFAAETDTELIAKLKPDLTKQIAAIVLPFLPLIDFRLMRSRDIALIIKPLQVIPQDMMFEALCYQAAHLGKATQILYRGPFVVQWDSNARYTMLQLSNTDDGRELSCMGFTGCARTVSPARGTGVYEWEFRIKHENLRSEIGIGLCTDRGPDSFKYAVWLGHESNGWILDSNSRFWHNTTCVPTKSNVTFSGLEARVLVRLDMSIRQCVFTYNDVRVVAPWINIPDEVYPAVSFLRSAAANRTQVKILPANCCEPVDL